MANLGFFGRKMRRNETKAPPDFPLHRITAPVSLHYSTVDRMATTPDVQKLITKLTGTKNLHLQEINSGEFNHIDFMWGTNAANVVYSDIIKFFSENTKWLAMLWSEIRYEIRKPSKQPINNRKRIAKNSMLSYYIYNRQ